MLYIVSTPIGHLADITQRAAETLANSDLILCEDTRRSRILLSHLRIRKPLRTLHKFNEKSQEKAILSDLKAGRSIALISDAGTPTLNDPGLSLIRACIAEGVPFTAIPGPCSYIQALVMSGFDTSRFQGIGFLPKGKKQKKEALLEALTYPGTTLAFESPKRLIDTLTLLHLIAPDRVLAVARELTKTFEECLRGTANELLKQYEGDRVRGEVILLIRSAEKSRNSEEPGSMIATSKRRTSRT